MCPSGVNSSLFAHLRSSACATLSPQCPAGGYATCVSWRRYRHRRAARILSSSMLRLMVLFRRAAWRAFQHDAFATAKAAAYSSILTLFPGFLLLASILAASNQTAEFTREISYAVGRVLPAGTTALAQAYLNTSNIRPVRVIFSASLVMITAASGVLVSWMSAFRRAYGIQGNPWGFWKERAMAFLLIPLSLIPLAFATILVGFGNQLQNWLAVHTIYELR